MEKIKKSDILINEVKKEISQIEFITSKEDLSQSDIVKISMRLIYAALIIKAISDTIKNEINEEFYRICENFDKLRIKYVKNEDGSISRI